MASMSFYKKRKCWRVNFTLKVGERRIRKTKYFSSNEQARLSLTMIGGLEVATKTRVANRTDIEDWIQRTWLSVDEAGEIFEGYSETENRLRKVQFETTDYDSILRSYENSSADIVKGGAQSRDHRKHLSQARQVIQWLKDDFPKLEDLTPEMIREKLSVMKGTYTDES